MHSASWGLYVHALGLDNFGSRNQKPYDGNKEIGHELFKNDIN